MSISLKPVKNRSLSDDVADTLREAIFSGRFKPGAPLREMHLAKELDVSQKTVRDALVKLERYGLVVRVPNKETTVTRHSRREVRQRLELRAILEEFAALRAAKLMKEADYVLLGNLVHSMERYCSQEQYFEAAQVDLDFHRYIWERADNETLYAVLDHLTVPLFAFISIMRSISHTGMKNTAEQHQELLNALKSKKAARISRAIRGHLTQAYDGFLNSDVESLEEMMTRRAG